MKDTRHLTFEPMSVADVLATIRDSYRHAEQLDPEAEPDIDLTLDSTIDEWRSACDLVSAVSLGHALNDWFDIEATPAQWWAVLEPAHRARLREVCALVVAQGAQRPALRPFRVSGVECAEAGAFFILRALLGTAGAPVAGARPSAPLSPWIREHVGLMITTVGRLAPGALPVPRIETSAWDGRSAAVLGLSR